MAVEEATLDGFRGGLAARRAPAEFGEEQWAKLHGFVIEDGGVLRSQWPLQRVSGIDDVASLGIYQGPGETPFLVAVKGNGDVYWREAPPDDAESGASELSGSWRPLLDEDGDELTGSNAPYAGVRPAVTVPLEAGELKHASGGLRSAMMLNSIGVPDGGDVWFVYEADDPDDEDERLRAMTLGSSAKWPEDDETEASPKAQHGAVWNGVLCLGDVEWKADPDSDLSESNKTRFRNGLWMSVPGEPLLFDPLSVLFIGDANTRVTGMVPTEQGLLVFTNSMEGIGGVHILRGTPDAFSLEPLHVGIGVTEGQANWTDTNTFTWLTEAGEVWQTDTDSVRRLDRQGLGVDQQTSPRDGVQSFGPWLVAARERRLFALRALDDGKTAAWTELHIDSLPGPVDMRYADVSGQSLYFLAEGEVHRFTRADIRTGASERGRTSAGLVDLSVGSRTLATGEGHDKTFWHRFGVRATAGHRAVEAEIDRIVLRAGPVLDDRAPSLTRPGPFTLVEERADDARPGTSRVTELEESWEHPDSSSMDGDLSWEGMRGSFELSDETAVSEETDGNDAFASDELSRDDHYARADVAAGTSHSVLVRVPGTGTRTFYRFTQDADGRRIQRVVGGSATTLASGETVESPPFQMELRAEGQQLTALIDGETVLTAFDSGIQTGRYAGIGAAADGSEFASFEAGARVPASIVVWGGADIVTWDGETVRWDAIPADLLPLPTHEPKRWQAIVRGIGASNECSVEAVCRGDVQVEQVGIFFQGSIRGGDEQGR